MFIMDIKISLADSSHKKELVDLWVNTFGDDEKFVTSFIDSYMIAEYNVPVAFVDGKIASAFYLVDFEFYSRLNCIGTCSYLFAAATKEEYRNKGLMSKLISYAAELYKNRGIKAIFLFPQNQSEYLFKYYSKFGFKDIYKTKKISEVSEISIEYDKSGVQLDTSEFTGLQLQLQLQNEDISNVEIFDELYNAYIHFTARQSLSPLKDRLFYFKCAKSYLDCEEKNTFFAIFKNNSEKFCYVFYKKFKNVYYIDDIIFTEPDKATKDSKNKQDKILSILMEYIKNQGCEYEINTLPVDISDKDNVPLAMILPLDKKIEDMVENLKVPIYLNMFMNM